MTKLTIDCGDFYNLAQLYRWEPVDAAKPFNALIDYIDAKLAEAYEQGKKDAAIKEITIEGDGFFAGGNVYLDPSLPLDTIEMRFGKKFVRIALPKEPTE
jgi:hypothetical protein